MEPTQPPTQWVQGALSLRVKEPGHEADHSPPSDAIVKNVELYLQSPIPLHGVVINELNTGMPLSLYVIRVNSEM
jgi:hypothetical protein